MSADRSLGRVILRVDAGRIAGVSMGHAFRCMALARELETFGFETVFLMTADPRGPAVVAEQGFLVETLSAGSSLADWRAAAERAQPTVVVIDLLRVSAATLSAFAGLAAPTVVLDDLGGLAADCDLLVNGSAVDKNLNYGPGRAKLRLGPQFMILGAEFCGAPVPDMRSELGAVLVTLGGSDPANLALPVLESAAEVVPNQSLTFIAGPAMAADRDGRERLEFMKTRFSVKDYVPDLSMRMMSADLVISAGGRSAYELAALGIPALVVPTNAHEVDTAKALERAGTCLAVSDFEVATCRAEIGPLLRRLSDANERRALSQAGQRLVDGRGGRRVAAEILGMTR